jgi:hypothetical protein
MRARRRAGEFKYRGAVFEQRRARTWGDKGENRLNAMRLRESFFLSQAFFKKSRKDMGMWQCFAVQSRKGEQSS